VEHDLDAFKEGKTMILTLQDKGKSPRNTCTDLLPIFPLFSQKPKIALKHD
jgi:hypothetical protein